jgi:hypothetical protein
MNRVNEMSEKEKKDKGKERSSSPRSYRIYDDLLEAMPKEAERNNITETELVCRAISAWFESKDTMKSYAMKKVKLSFEGRCVKCGAQLPSGTTAWWGRTPTGSVFMCVNCEVLRFSDAAMVEKFSRMREMDLTLKALTRACNEKADVLNLTRSYERYDIFTKKSIEVFDLIISFMKQSLGAPDEKQKWDEAMKKLDEVRDYGTDFSEYIYTRTVRPERKKKQKQEAEPEQT